MYELAKKSREALKSKARRLAAGHDATPDASNWKPSEPLNAHKKTGKQPTTRSAFKDGGKVEGEKRKGKNLGGVMEVLSPAYGLVRALQRGGKDEERDVAEQAKGMAMANQMAGRKHGGKVKKADGGSTGKGGTITMLNGRRRMYQGQNGTSGAGMPSDKTSEASEREGRASGGRAKAKGKTNISINILAGGKTPPMAPAAAPVAAPAAAAPPPPLTPPVPMPNAIPPGTGDRMPMGIPENIQGPAQRAAPIALKRGGRAVATYKDMTAGSKSGEGRLQKAEIQKKRRA